MPAEECKKLNQPPAATGGFVLRAIVFANGEFDPPRDLVERLAAADLILSADGGLAHADAAGVQPHVLTGDMDSLAAAEFDKLEALGVEVRRYPKEKNQTDLELVLLVAKERGAREIEVLGGLGRRWDHSLANVQMLGQPEFSQLQISFLHGEQRLFLIRDQANIQGEVGTLLSLIPIRGDVDGVSTMGLAYPLTDERLLFGSSRGVSNVFVMERVRVEVERGLLLCVISPGEFD